MNQSDNPRWEQMAESELEELVAGGIASIDAPPDHVAEAARAAFEMRDLDGQLRRLTATDAMAVVRDDDTDRADVRVDLDDGTVGVSVERVAGGWHVTGTAPGSSTITVTSTGGGSATVDVDDTGYFEHTLRAGVGEAVRVIVGDRFVTPWMP